MIRVTPLLHDGTVFMRVDAPSGHFGYATEAGERIWMTSPGPTSDIVFETVLHALAEWFYIDKTQYGGANAEKIRRSA